MKTKTILQMMGLSLLIFVMVNCQKKDNINQAVPVVKAIEITNITTLSATSGGEIISDGGAEITSIGYCISESPDPTIKTMMGKDGGEDNKFDIYLKDLKPNTTYYIRTFASNGAGTGYSEVISFKTVAEETVTDIDGNVYTIIKIGTLKVMDENLRTTRYRNGDPIPNVESKNSWVSLNTGARFVQNDVSYYNWPAVNDPRNIAPQGWHVPDSTEAKMMISPFQRFTCFSYRDPTTGSLDYNITHLAGLNPAPIQPAPGGGFWTSTADKNENACFIYHTLLTTVFGTQGTLSFLSNVHKRTGMPVRCIKDE